MTNATTEMPAAKPIVITLEDVGTGSGGGGAGSGGGGAVGGGWPLGSGGGCDRADNTTVCIYACMYVTKLLVCTTNIL